MVLQKWTSDKGSIPNKFTIGMGELIQKARIETKLSVSDLADGIYTNKKTVEAFEKGEKEVSSSELTYLAAVLDKPLTYFFPEYLLQYLNPSYMTVEELEILRLVKRLSGDDRRKLVAQIRAIIDAS